MAIVGTWLVGMAMIAVECRNARGEVISRISVDSFFNPVLLGVDQTDFPMLAGIDPYGDTFFNYLQVKRLLLELDVYAPEHSESAAFFAQLTDVCNEALAKPHRFLRFVGD
ncbi:hypothetical protein ACQP2P_26115 [Dactylosporangium sp. CA-139114]|uniref:hypothetical protein n=1 Tax=Dactylosporangium sp. CA-139114 TaxID=3239931 RepID=UPI003D96CBD9